MKKLKIDEEIISFKSFSKHYVKEQDGRKPCNIRLTEEWGDERWFLFNIATHVRIINRVTKKYFIRKITDKTVFGDFALISWNPNEK